MDSTQDIMRDISKDNNIEIIRGLNKKLINNNYTLEDLQFEAFDSFKMDENRSKEDIFDLFLANLFGKNMKMQDF